MWSIVAERGEREKRGRRERGEGKTTTDKILLVKDNEKMTVRENHVK